MMLHIFCTDNPWGKGELEDDSGKKLAAVPADETAMKPYLTRNMVQKLAQSLVNEEDVWKLALRGLHLPEWMVNQYLESHGNVNEAAEAILIEWLQTQPDGCTAYENLVKGLRAADMKELLQVLGENMEEVGDKDQEFREDLQETKSELSDSKILSIAQKMYEDRLVSDLAVQLKIPDVRVEHAMSRNCHFPKQAAHEIL